MQSVAGRTGAVTLSASDVSGAEATANKGVANGYASLNSSSLVVQNPANASSTPGTSKIVISDPTTGKVDGWVTLNGIAPTTTKGDIIGHNGSSNVRVPVGADNRMLVADSAQSSGVGWAQAWKTILKTTDEGRTNNQTLADDAVLKFPVTSGVVYAFRLFLYVDTNATADFKFSFAGPSMSVFVAHNESVQNGASALTVAAPMNATGVTAVWNGAGALGVLTVQGTCTPSATGTLSLQWAQNSSNGGATTVKAGSRIEFTSS